MIHGRDDNGIIKKGFLLKRTNGILRFWRMRYFVLSRACLLCFRKQSDLEDGFEPKFKLELAEISVEPLEDSVQEHSSLMLFQGRFRIVLRGKENDISDWFRRIRDAADMCKTRFSFLQEFKRFSFKRNVEENVRQKLSNANVCVSCIPAVTVLRRTCSEQTDEHLADEFVSLPTKRCKSLQDEKLLGTDSFIPSDFSRSILKQLTDEVRAFSKNKGNGLSSMGSSPKMQWRPDRKWSYENLTDLGNSLENQLSASSSYVENSSIVADNKSTINDYDESIYDYCKTFRSCFEGSDSFHSRKESCIRSAFSAESLRAALKKNISTSFRKRALLRQYRRFDSLTDLSGDEDDVGTRISDDSNEYLSAQTYGSFFQWENDYKLTNSFAKEPYYSMHTSSLDRRSRDKPNVPYSTPYGKTNGYGSCVYQFTIHPPKSSRRRLSNVTGHDK